MSNSNNFGKEIKRLRKELDELTSKDRRFHFLVLTPGETEEGKLKELIVAGTMDIGDEYQVVHIPWKISPLRGANYIPEGSDEDPLGDPRLRKPELAEPIFTTSWAEKREREERWKKHEQQIERAGERFDPDKPKDRRGIY